MVVFLSMERKQINTRKNWQVKIGCLYKGMYELWVNPKRKLKQSLPYKKCFTFAAFTPQTAKLRIEACIHCCVREHTTI